MNNFTIERGPFQAFSRSIQDQVDAPPKAGEGVHNWLFRTALGLHRHIEADQIAEILRTAVAGCGRVVPEREIRDAVKNSAAFRAKVEGGIHRAGDFDSGARHLSWPAIDAQMISEITSRGGGLSRLRGASMPIPPDSESVIDLLFPPASLICCGLENWRFSTRTREEWRGHLGSRQFIVPSPMSAPHGRKRDGTGLSEHTLDNTGPRRFLVIEFDRGTLDQQAAIHLHLAHHGALVMVVFSGRQSLHGWHACNGHDETKVRTFFEHAVRLGADPRTWTRSQFVRMPWGVRSQTDGSKIAQSVIFFNPKILTNAKQS